MLLIDKIIVGENYRRHYLLLLPMFAALLLKKFGFV